METRKKYRMNKISLRREFLIVFGIWMVACLGALPTFAQNSQMVIHLAKLEIDSAQLDSYKAALKEGVETSVRLETGVLMLYALYEKDHPTRVTVVEIYASPEAYQAHLTSPHFIKYKTATKDMVKSLQLVDQAPISLASKIKL